MKSPDSYYYALSALFLPCTGAPHSLAVWRLQASLCNARAHAARQFIIFNNYTAAAKSKAELEKAL